MPEIPFHTLHALLEEAYTLTYRDSSLKVRRRYRNLICHLARRGQYEQVVSQATHDGTDDEGEMACRARRQSA